MTRDEILNSISLKKRFVKDCNLSIAVFDNPYFYERLKALNFLDDSLTKFDIFCQELESYACEQDYFEQYNLIKDSIITDLKENTQFKILSLTQLDFKSEYPKRNVYIEDNDGLLFVSLDMKKANFSALHHWSPSIFKGYQTWEKFIGQYTDKMHIINSKYIRQVIMGACNPKKQIQYERYLMLDLLQHITPYIRDSFDVFSLGEDEIILQPKEKVGSLKDVEELEHVINNALNGSSIKNYIRTTIFRLEKIKGTDGWIKHLIHNPKMIEFKCLNSEIYHQVIKYYFGEEITENDLVFYHNGTLAKFLEPIPNPWS